MANKATNGAIGTGASAPALSLFRRVALLVCCILMLTRCETEAQKLARHYTTTPQPDGVLYFIKPQNNFSYPNNKNGWSMDVTCFDSKDSATINFTCFDANDLNLQSIILVSGQWQYRAPVKRIYADLVKNLWRYRYTFRIPFGQLALFYAAEQPAITLHDAGQPAITVEPTKRWTKNYGTNNQIIQIIRKNRRN